jgi:Bifunctional DNA primase/polymerase, N-terminal
MTPLAYAAQGWPVFPCDSRKRPLTDNGFKDATSDEGQVREWWARWPYALTGVPTGEAIGCVVLDVDTKHGVNGFRTLDELNGAERPATPTALTPSGGAHFYFARPEGGLRNTAGERGRGIGPGLDWRGDGGYVIVPSPGSGYRWGERHFGNCQPLPVPAQLLPKITLAARTERPAQPIPHAIGLSRYAEGALDTAARAIINAPDGEQEATLNGECFSIGTLAGAGGIPVDFARKVLLWAGRQMRDYNPARPWLLGEVEFKVNRAFNDGMRQPRGSSHAA